MKQIHRVIEIDPAAFADQVPTETGTGTTEYIPTETGTGTTEYIFDEADVLKFLIDAMNEARISISMINHDHEIAIEYQGKRNYFSMGIASLDAPEGAAIDGMAELSYILNDHEGIESWTSYKNEKHALHILRSKPSEMTATEIREAEDNIEAV
jgi:hypothetical protein